MNLRLMGIETEYAAVATTQDGMPAPPPDVAGGLYGAARAGLRYLVDDIERGIFLENGARFYIDHGFHPEFSTPECDNPWDIVRYVKAGDRILLDLAERFGQGWPKVKEIRVLRHNVDYSGTGSTWGCHESYLYRGEQRVIGENIIPHLVTRIIYAGAGGFNSRSPGIEFVLSPRVPHMRHVVSADSTRSRGIFHTKNESLCKSGYKRLHLLCSESVHSERAVWLRVGTTALIVALAEAGLRPGEQVRLRSPLRSMRALTLDRSCQQKLALASGARVTPIAVQRHYLEQVEAYRRHVGLPLWAEAVCESWRESLDRLERDPFELARVLDWPAKWLLFHQHAKKRGFSWDEIERWNRLVKRLSLPVAPSVGRSREAPRMPPTIGRAGSESGGGELLPHFARYRLARERLDPFLRLRQELFEIDTRFGELGDRGLFAGLERAGVLAHRVVESEEVTRAMVKPPARGRARVRGELVAKLAGTGTHHCSWSSVRDGAARMMVDLSDPFTEEARWEAIPVEKLRFPFSF
ncbi:MAG: proteasome accessory factor PafA2 family protein [Planctomycetota bacterium]